MKSGVSLNEQELLILQELMNIAFGSASADLEEVLDLSIDLRVPEAETVPVSELKDYIAGSMKLDDRSSMVEEKFWGEFSGSSILVFPEAVGKNLLSILSHPALESTAENQIGEMDQGVLLEVGNILIGACIGKISELLNTVVTYSPPYIELGKRSNLDFFVENFEPGSYAIILKTEFVFHQEHLNGRLMIITGQDSIAWMKAALNSFMEDYG